MKARLCAAAMALALVAGAAPARAAPTAQERAVAESLFREGKELAAGGSLAAACAKFEESQRLDPQLGTLLHLATCHQELGMTASAWVELEEAEALARKAGDARAAIARQRADALEGKLSYLVVEVEEPGVEVTLDGKALGPATFGTPIPVDPREHVLAASAPGKKPWSRALAIPAGPHRERVTIPALAGEPAATPPSPSTASSSSPAPQAIAGFVLGGVGLVGLGVGSAFGLIAKSQADEADDDHCEGQFCTPEGLELHDRAQDSALASTILFAVGAASLATGIVLVVTAPSTDDEARVWLKPAIGARAGTLTAGGRW